MTTEISEEQLVALRSVDAEYKSFETDGWVIGVKKVLHVQHLIPDAVRALIRQLLAERLTMRSEIDKMKQIIIDCMESADHTREAFSEAIRSRDEWRAKAEAAAPARDLKETK